MGVGVEDEVPDADAGDAHSRTPRPRVQNVVAPESGGPYACPCCGLRTLPARGAYDWCPECDWEDDGQDDHDSGVVRDGPNGGISLDAAREAYRRHGGQRRRGRLSRIRLWSRRR